MLFAFLGATATFTSLLPGFILFGLGAGLMNVPLTNAILEGVPTERAGVASALFNASREVAGLLGVTVVGAVLRSTEAAAIRSGTRPAQAFIDGYHSGLWLTIGLLAAGVVLSYVTLRPRLRPAATGSAGLEAAELGLAELVLGEPFEPVPPQLELPAEGLAPYRGLGLGADGNQP
jgi:hypothetical protein